MIERIALFGWNGKPKFCLFCHYLIKYSKPDRQKNKLKKNSDCWLQLTFTFLRTNRTKNKGQHCTDPWPNPLC